MHRVGLRGPRVCVGARACRALGRCLSLRSRSCQEILTPLSPATTRTPARPGRAPARGAAPRGASPHPSPKTPHTPAISASLRGQRYQCLAVNSHARLACLASPVRCLSPTGLLLRHSHQSQPSGPTLPMRRALQRSSAAYARRELHRFSPRAVIEANLETGRLALEQNPGGVGLSQPASKAAGASRGRAIHAAIPATLGASHGFQHALAHGPQRHGSTPSLHAAIEAEAAMSLAVAVVVEGAAAVAGVLTAAVLSTIAIDRALTRWGCPDLSPLHGYEPSEC